jgi:hypothetical protein
MAPTTLADPVSAELRSILRALKLGKNKTLTAPVPKPYQLYRRGSELVRLGDPQGHRRPPRRSEALVAARLCPAGPTCRAELRHRRRSAGWLPGGRAAATACQGTPGSPCGWTAEEALSSCCLPRL